MASSRKALSRREAIKAAAAAASAPLISESATARTVDNEPRTPRKLVGIQIGAVAYAFDLLMRYVEHLVVPWKGKV